MLFALLPNFTFTDNKETRKLRRAFIVADFLCNLASMIIFDYIFTLIFDICFGQFSLFGGVSYLGMLLLIVFAVIMTGVTYKKALPLVPEQETDIEKDA